MTLQDKRAVKDHQVQIRMSKNEYEILEKLSVFEDRSLSDTLRVCFMREARLRLSSNALKNVPTV
jgi:hypothetical protein